MGKTNAEAEQMKDRVVSWIREYFEENGPGCNAVVGISGGKDSAVVAALCAEALGKDRVLGVKMPCQGQEDIEYADALIDFLGVEALEIDIGEAYDAVCRLLTEAMGQDIPRPASISLKPRLRMCVLYAVAQTRNGRVANTGNKSENAVGYYTRFGDGAGDFAPIANLTVTQVIAVGKACGLPARLVEKPPSDGLCGKTDEEALGFGYADLDRFLKYGCTGDYDVDAAINESIVRSEWKRKDVLPSFAP